MWNVLKSVGLVELTTAQIMYKERNYLWSGNIQKMLADRKGGYNLKILFKEVLCSYNYV